MSALFWAFLALSAPLLFTVALTIFLVTLPFDRNGLLMHLFTSAWGQLVFHVNPNWRLKVEGRRKIPWRGPAVLVANHQSLGDILVLFGLYRPFKWVSKESVFKVPFIGWNMALNRYVSLRRGDKESVLKMFAACERWLGRGVPILLFPEGTRSFDGDVKPFKDGAFQLAVKQRVPIIPVVVTGTARTLPKHGFVLREFANCRVKVLDPIDPAPFGDDFAALRDHVRELIIAEKQRLEALEASPTASALSAKEVAQSL